MGRGLDVSRLSGFGLRPYIRAAARMRGVCFDRAVPALTVLSNESAARSHEKQTESLSIFTAACHLVA